MDLRTRAAHIVFAGGVHLYSLLCTKELIRRSFRAILAAFAVPPQRADPLSGSRRATREVYRLIRGRT